MNCIATHQIQCFFSGFSEFQINIVELTEKSTEYKCLKECKIIKMPTPTIMYHCI